MAASLSGVLVSSTIPVESLERYLKILIAFALGVFVVLTYSLFSELIEARAHTSLIIGSALLGIILLQFGSLLIPDAHHHHSPHHAHTHTKIDARRMLLGDAFHNVSDGIILVPAFMQDIRIGIAITGALFLHELVQEIAQFFILREAGYTTKEALIRNGIVSSTILIGIALAGTLSAYTNIALFLSALAGGGFVYIIIRDLLPSVIRSTRVAEKKSPFFIAFIFGFVLMLGLQYILPHEHDEAPIPNTYVAYSNK